MNEGRGSQLLKNHDQLSTPIIVSDAFRDNNRGRGGVMIGCTMPGAERYTKCFKDKHGLQYKFQFMIRGVKRTERGCFFFVFFLF